MHLACSKAHPSSSRRTGEEERITALPGAFFRQRLQVPQLLNWETPKCNKVVNAMRFLRKPCPKSDRITSDGGKVMVSLSLYSLLAAFNTHILFTVGDVFELLIVAVLVVPLDPSASDNEEVSGSEGHSLLFRYGFEVTDGDTVVRHRVIPDAMAFSVSDVVEQNTSAYDASAFAPV